MRRTTPAPTSYNDTYLCRLLAPGLDLLSPFFASAANLCHNKDTQSIQGVLQTLKTATEAYLNTNICFAALALDVLESPQIAAAQQSLRTLGLHQILPTAPATKPIVLAHRPSTAPRFDQEPWLVLAIDHSANWFNIGVLTLGEAGIVDTLPDFARSPTIGEERQLAALEHRLSSILTSDARLPGQIHHLVLYGDDAHNEALRGLLVKMLSAELVRDARVSRSVFDGTNFTARTAYLHMDTADFEMNVKPAWACRWRSRLISGARNEL